MYAPAQKMSSGISCLRDEIAIYFNLAVEKGCANAYITRHAGRATYNRRGRKAVETQSKVGAECYLPRETAGADGGEYLCGAIEGCRAIQASTSGAICEERSQEEGGGVMDNERD